MARDLWEEQSFGFDEGLCTVVTEDARILSFRNLDEVAIALHNDLITDKDRLMLPEGARLVGEVLRESEASTMPCGSEERLVMAALENPSLSEEAVPSSLERPSGHSLDDAVLSIVGGSAPPPPEPLYEQLKSELRERSSEKPGLSRCLPESGEHALQGALEKRSVDSDAG